MASQIPPSAPSIRFGWRTGGSIAAAEKTRREEIDAMKANSPNLSSASSSNSLEIGLAAAAAAAAAVVTSVGALAVAALHRHGKQH